MDVKEVKRVQNIGLYAPLTPSRTIVVGGMKASNYVSLKIAENHWLFAGKISWFSHFGAAPFRLACRQISATFCQDYRKDGISSLLAMMKGYFDLFIHRSFFQVLGFIIYFVVAAICSVVDWAFSICDTQVALATVAALSLGGITIGAVMRVYIKKVSNKGRRSPFSSTLR